MVSINGVPFGAELFKNGEAILKDSEHCLKEYDNVIRVRFRGNEDITLMLLAYQYVKAFQQGTKVKVELLYMPYSRMDREINDQIFSLRLMAKTLATMENAEVIILDPHSEVTESELKNTGIHYRIDTKSLEKFIYLAFSLCKPDVICMPDKGAYAKYIPICKNALGDSMVPYIHGEKKRNLNDKGKIEKLTIDNEGVDLKNKRVLIVDDICSFGGTAIRAAQALKEKGVKEVYLYITHSEENIFKGDVFKSGAIDGVFTTDSIITKDDVKNNENIVIMPY
jgi:ribose-phosphate pyrophosphokinase